MRIGHLTFPGPIPLSTGRMLSLIHILLAGVMFRAGTQTFLDNMTADELSQRTGKKIKIVDVDGSAFVQALTEPATVKKRCTKGKDTCI